MAILIFHVKYKYYVVIIIIDTIVIFGLNGYVPSLIDQATV